MADADTAHQGERAPAHAAVRQTLPGPEARAEAQRRRGQGLTAARLAVTSAA